MRSKGTRFCRSPSVRRRALSISALSTFARSKPIRSNRPNMVGRRVEATRTRLFCPALWAMLIRTPQFLFVGLSGDLEFIGLCRSSYEFPLTHTIRLCTQREDFFGHLEHLLHLFQLVVRCLD